MSTRSDQIMKVMTAMNISREKAEAIVDLAMDDPVKFREIQEILQTMRQTPMAEGKLKGIQLRCAETAVGRNDRCPCGSGRKFKKCCGKKPRAVGIIVHREKDEENFDSEINTAGTTSSRTKCG